MNLATGSGTTAYMGPERFSKDPTPLKASDIWSLGATAYELLTGNAPFGEIGGGMQKGGADLPTIKQDISPELRMVLAKMLAIETWDRPTADQLVKWADDHEQINFSTSGNAEEPVTRSQADDAKQPVVSSPRDKKGLIIGAIVAAVVLLSGVGAWMVKLKHDRNIDQAIKIQLEISKTCDKYIADLNERNILDKLDLTIEEMRKLERFENESPFASKLKMKLSPEKTKALM